MVLVIDPEAEADRVVIEVLRYRMMVMLGSGRTPFIGSIGRWVGMVAVGEVGRMRFRMIVIHVPVRRHLEQVHESQGRDDARPERAWKSRRP